MAPDYQPPMKGITRKRKGRGPFTFTDNDDDWYYEPPPPQVKRNRKGRGPFTFDQTPSPPPFTFDQTPSPPPLSSPRAAPKTCPQRTRKGRGPFTFDDAPVRSPQLHYRRVPNTCPAKLSQVSELEEIPEQQRKKDIEVLWDYESTGVPYDLDRSSVYEEFVKSLRKRGFSGRIQIRLVLGYLNSVTPKVLADLRKNKDLIFEFANHFNSPPGSTGNQAADNWIINHIKALVEEKVEPKIVMIVSCDNDYEDSLKLLKEAFHFTIAVVRKVRNKNVSLGLVNSSDVVWDWRTFFELGEGESNKKRKEAYRRLHFGSV